MHKTLKKSNENNGVRKNITSLVNGMRGVKWRFLHTFFLEHAVKIEYRKAFGEEINLKNPKTINEKLQYLKLHDYKNNALVAQCADKYRVREYIKNKGLEDILPKLYFVYEKAEDIRWDALPQKFVMKYNHGCGFNILCKDKSTLDIKSAKKSLRKWHKINYWRVFGEIHYKHIPKRIIVEEYLGDDIATYKFYCFNGAPKMLYISYRGEDGEQDKYVTYYDLDLNELPYELMPHPRKRGRIEKPENYETMLEYAKILSEDFIFVRVDLYNINGKIYLSELTFLPTGGFMRIIPKGSDAEWGNMLDLKVQK